MSLATFVKILSAKSQEEYEQLSKEHRESELLSQSDGEVITEFLNNCTDLDGNPILEKGERVELNDEKLEVKKNH